MNDEKITQTELFKLFGDAIPLEAAHILFSAPPEMTVDEVRDKIRKFAMTWRAGLQERTRIEVARNNIDFGVERIRDLLAIKANPRGAMIEALSRAADLMENAARVLNECS